MRYHFLCSGELGDASWTVASDGGPRFRIDDHEWLTARKFRLLGEEPSLTTEARVYSTWRHQNVHICRGGEIAAHISTSLLADIRARFVGDVPGPDVLTVTGCFVEQNYRFLRCSRTVASVSTVWDGDGTGFVADVRDNEDQALILASVLAIRCLCGAPMRRVSLSLPEVQLPAHRRMRRVEVSDTVA